jgi:hypothetical protein
MKSVLSKQCCEKEEKPFPKLMISHQGKLVLFTKPEEGMVLAMGMGHEPVGKYTSGFAMSVFRDYEGDVCLTNS